MRLGRGPLGLLVALCWSASFVACGATSASDESGAGDGVPDPTGAGGGVGGKADGFPEWATVGYGATYRDMPNATGEGIAVLYGGYTAQLPWVQSWATELWDVRLAALGIRHLYAVQGPKDSAYSAAEIGNSGLAKHLVARVGAGPSRILVAAHSSGTFPAHELFRHLFVNGLDPDHVTWGRIVYYHLEGGTLGLDTGLVSKLAKTYFVSARDETINTLAANYWVSQELGTKYQTAGAASLVVEVPESGCAPGARWCLHDAVINTRPHDPNAYDLEHDYQIFDPAPRAAQTDWLDQGSADGW